MLGIALERAHQKLLRIIQLSVAETRGSGSTGHDKMYFYKRRDLGFGTYSRQSLDCAFRHSYTFFLIQRVVIASKKNQVKNLLTSVSNVSSIITLSVGQRGGISRHQLYCRTLCVLLTGFWTVTLYLQLQNLFNFEIYFLIQLNQDQTIVLKQVLYK